MTSGRMSCPPFLQKSPSPKYFDKVWFPKLGKAPDPGNHFESWNYTSQPNCCEWFPYPSPELNSTVPPTPSTWQNVTGNNVL